MEFALGIIIVLTIFCAIFEFSWVFYNYEYLNNAASKGARAGVGLAGSTVNSVSATCAAVVTSMPGGLAVNMVGFTCMRGATVINTTCSSGDVITVKATISYSNITPLSSLVQMSSFNTLSANCQTRVE